MLTAVIERYGHAQTYVLRQPERSQQAVYSAYYQDILTPADVNSIEPVDRDAIASILNQVERFNTGNDRLLALRRIARVDTPSKRMDIVLVSINTNLLVLTKETVKIFDTLLPAVNTLHNYFQLIEEFAADDAFKKIWARAYRLFKSSLILKAQELYAKALALKAKGSYPEALKEISHAQALLYRLKNESEQAKALFDELDKYQPIPFDQELKRLTAIGLGDFRV